MVIFLELDKIMDCFFCVYIQDKWKNVSKYLRVQRLVNCGTSPRDTSDVVLQNCYEVFITFGEAKGFQENSYAIRIELLLNCCLKYKGCVF